MPEAGVQQVQHRVLGATHVQVDGHPVLLRLRIHQGACIAWVDVAQVVPAAARPLRGRCHESVRRATTSQCC